jgi:hypothetical protein
MKSNQFSLFSKKILEIGERRFFAQFIRLKETQRGAFGITAVDRLYPLKPKKPV